MISPQLYDDDNWGFVYGIKDENRAQYIRERMKIGFLLKSFENGLNMSYTTHIRIV